MSVVGLGVQGYGVRVQGGRGHRALEVDVVHLECGVLVRVRVRVQARVRVRVRVSES